LAHLPTTDIMSRVFCLHPQHLDSVGSCFSVPIGETVCLITAKHVVESLPEGQASKFELYKNGAWVEFDAVPYFCDAGIDIAILQTTIPCIPTSCGLELSAGGAHLGQDVFFFGFPYFGILEYLPERLNDSFPFPLVKKAILSGMQSKIFYLDGHNNPGFSGGPVVFYDLQTRKNKIAAVISAYITQTGEVIQIPTENKLIHKENSGIIVTYQIKYAAELINKVYGRGPNMPQEATTET
jgi:hypothetical protein